MAKDKKLHIYAGFLISILGACLSNSALFGFLLAFLAGILKEAYDKISGKGTVEGLDCLATMTGGLIPYLIMLGVQQYGRY